MASFYVYKYENNGVPIYIGQTIHLKRRILEHEKDTWYKASYNIYYIKCNNKTEMDGLEYFLIKKYKPKYNRQHNNNNESQIEISEPYWIKYSAEQDDNTSKQLLFRNIPKDLLLKQAKKIIANKRPMIGLGTYSKEQLIAITGMNDLSDIKRSLKNQGYSYITNGKKGRNYLLTITKVGRPKISAKEKIANLLIANSNMNTMNDIAFQTGFSRETVSKCLKEIMEEKK